MYQTLQQGSIGTVLEFTVTSGNAILPLVNCNFSLTILKPNKTRLIKTPVLSTDGTDGRIKYTAIAGDFDIEGTYYIQAIVEPIGIEGDIFPTNVEVLKVLKNI